MPAYHNAWDVKPNNLELQEISKILICIITF